MQDPALIVAGIDALGDHDGVGLAEETAKAERELRAIQMEEDRATRLYVSGKITENQLDLQGSSSLSGWRASERRWTTTAHGRPVGRRSRS